MKVYCTLHRRLELIHTIERRYPMRYPEGFTHSSNRPHESAVEVHGRLVCGRAYGIVTLRHQVDEFYDARVGFDELDAQAGESDRMQAEEAEEAFVDDVSEEGLD